MKLSPNDESQSKFARPHFREVSPQVRLSCPESSSDPYELSNKSVPKDLLHLSRLVGNPATEESVWMNACIGAGTRSLTPKHSILFRLSSFLKTGLGATFALLTVLLNFTIAISLTGQGAYFLRGISINDFFRAFPAVDGLGLLVALLAGLCFWSSLLCKSRKATNLVASISAFGVSSVVLLAGYLDLLSNTLIAFLCFASVLVFAKIGTLCREALPSNFSAVKLAQSTIGILTVPAVFTVWLLSSATTSSHEYTRYGEGNLVSVSIFLALMAFCVVGQGYAMAKASKSSSRLACTFLAVCLQAPLVVGLVVSTCFAAVAAVAVTVDPNFTIHQQFLYQNYLNIWKSIAGDKVLLLIGVSLLTVPMAAAGGYLGALANCVKRSKAT
jgi:hypothetical protein